MRYGDEIGMGDDLSLPERESRAHADAVDADAERRLLAGREDRVCR